MTWAWDQSAGTMSRNGKVVGNGYAGHNLAKNKPEMQEAHSVGPIPRGMWKMIGVHDSPNTGPFTIVLLPEPETDTFGRGTFGSMATPWLTRGLRRTGASSCLGRSVTRFGKW